MTTPQPAFDITDANWWAWFVYGMFTLGEWRLMGLALVFTYCATYILNIAYKSVINGPIQNKNHIRLLSLIAGFIASFVVWHMWADGVTGVEWWAAGMIAGPASILLYHVLLAAASNPPVNKLAPWLYPIIKGQKEQRNTSTRTKSKPA